ncbi:protein argonaute 2 [Sesamum alatum]|uniref:Protein argonaute 2 n=1 Tax=Sesamum alatum TaxID=300844 RepID=A0AAE1Z1N2_9LAMI|nr:protein argonaute 2 [Sesamum alatum]
MDSGRSNSGRGDAAGGRGRGRGRGRGNNQNQGGGRGWDLGQQQGVSSNQVPPQQVSSYTPLQTSATQQQHELGGGRGAWTGRPLSAPSPPSPVQPMSPPQMSPHQSAIGGRGVWIGRPWGSPPPSPVQPLSPPQMPPQQSATGGRGVWTGRPWGSPPPSPVQPLSPPQMPPQQSATGGRGVCTGRPWGLSPPSPSPSPVPVRPLSPPQKPLQQSAADELGVQKLKISEQSALPSASESKESQMQAIRRPDKGGSISNKSIGLLVNHFAVEFDPEGTIFHYNVNVKPESSNDNRLGNKTLRKSGMRLIMDKLFSRKALFRDLNAGYDGEKNMYSLVELPTGNFEVEISEGEEIRSGSYSITIHLANKLMLSRLNDYIRGILPHIPRDILQGMDLVMKENPSRRRISVGRSFYSSEYRTENDLSGGVAAYRGFQQSLKPTSQGLALCLDYSVLAFWKPLPVIEFLIEHLKRQFTVDHVKTRRQEVNNALKGLKVRVTHRRTKQKYTIAGLTAEDARVISFQRVDPEGKNPPETIRLVEYFKDKWDKDIMYQDIPCLELGTEKKSNKVPMEFCVLVEGQRYLKEPLDKNVDRLLKKLSLPKPKERKNAIDEMVKADDGPCGSVTRNSGIRVHTEMTGVEGRVLHAPDLKIGGDRSVQVNVQKCQWNLLDRTLVDGKTVERWALLDFTDGDRGNRLQASAFVNNLMGRCNSLDIQMAEPLLYQVTRMNELSSVNRLEKLLRFVVEKCGTKAQGKLQMIVCVMTRTDPGYKYIKWVAETRIGVVTQCCLSSQANKGQDQYLANLCLKINAKLGGSNFELMGDLPHFDKRDHVMFIGADVNHPGPMNKSCPSIAAVVATVNWPAANRYAARVSPQAHRSEEITNFGTMCLDLVNTYYRLNKVKPRRILVFRDGVSEGQFEMVRSQELADLKGAICDGKYQPAITLVVAQKRHQTRLFVEKENDGVSGNVPPGTVVDTKIVHPQDFDFYLCSHHGGLGTSKPTHYYVLRDENAFTSDELQKLIYDMCFTYARCTKPVSLVPPVYYADLVAYRGRMFQEVVLGTQSSMSSSPSVAASTSASSTPSFDPSFYTLHPDLENIMFFV